MMLLLSSLGADRKTIIDDYLLTNECNSDRIETVRKKYASYDLSEEELKAIIFVSGGVFADYMDYAIDTLKDRYGSVMGYIKDELGFTDSDMLKEKYLVQG
ncbi:MAG: tyrosine-protein phosphatase [Lachnospiraceae bacterium]|nr:tyrosine-protein phosphatase [Lachnospiraceae bacterium]